MKLIGGDTLLWQGGLSVGVGPRPRGPVDQAPTAGRDHATAVAGSQIIVPVLANDIDPEGGPLTLSAASARHGTAVANADGTLSYTAPAGFSGIDTASYTVTDLAGNAVQGEVSIEVILLSVSEGGTEGEFVVVSALGELIVTVVEPDEEPQNYVLQTSDLDDGPVNLRPPRISGTPEAGATLTAVPGLWAFDEAQGPLSVTRTWMRGATPIAGATGLGYVVDGAADAGQSLHMVETARTARGTRPAESPPVEVPGSSALWTPAALSGLALWFDASDASTLTLAGAEVTQIADKSGNGRHATRRFTAGPTSGSITSPSGLNMVDCGVDQVLRFPHPIAGSASRSVVMTVGALSGRSRRLFSLGQQNFWTWVSHDDGGAVVWRLAGNGANVVTSVGSEAAGLVGFFHEGPTFAGTAIMRDGTYHAGITADSRPVDTGPEDGNLGAHWLTQGYAPGPIGEVVVCDALLSEADRQKVEGYLAHKWGYADLLPAAHPYKAGPPRA